MRLSLNSLFFEKISNEVGHLVEHVKGSTKDYLKITIKEGTYNKNGDIVDFIAYKDVVLFENQVMTSIKGSVPIHPFGLVNIPHSTSGILLSEFLGLGSGIQKPYFWTKDLLGKNKLEADWSFKMDNQYKENITAVEWCKWIIENLAESGIEVKEKKILFNERKKRIQKSVQKIENQNILVIGAGGTGSHIIEALVKSDVKSITIVDNDELETHNTFRMPGVNFGKIGENKAETLILKYKEYKTKIIALNDSIQNIDISENIDFVFIAVDNFEARKSAIEKTISKGLQGIDVGIWVDYVPHNSELDYAVRVSDVNQNYLDGLNLSGVGAYKNSIQIYELNSINAGIAVIEYKRKLGIYVGENYNEINLIGGMEFDND